MFIVSMLILVSGLGVWFLAIRECKLNASLKKESDEAFEKAREAQKLAQERLEEAAAAQKTNLRFVVSHHAATAFGGQGCIEA